MDDTQNTIGLTELLDEVDHDLTEFRKKHSNDYSLKGITLWWELERERLVIRHGNAIAVKAIRQARNFKRRLAYFFAGWIVSTAMSLATQLFVS